MPRRDFGLTGLEHREGLGEGGEPPDGDGGEQGWHAALNVEGRPVVVDVDGGTGAGVVEGRPTNIGIEGGSDAGVVEGACDRIHRH